MIGKLRLNDQLPGASVYNCRNCSQFKSVVVEEMTLTEKRATAFVLVAVLLFQAQPWLSRRLE
jgi:hypothetical protein